MKTLISVIIYLIFGTVTYAQQLLEELKNYDYSKAKHIVRDSLFMDEAVGKYCEFYEDKTDTNITFEIIPVCHFKKDIEYIPDSSVIDYLKIDTFNITSNVIYKGKVVGIVSGYLTNTVYPNNEIDSVTGEILVWTMNSYYEAETYRWKRNYENLLCINKFSYSKKIHNFLVKEQPQIFFFSDFYYHPELWFMRGDKLMVYAYTKDEIFEEKEYISGIKKWTYKNPKTGEIIPGKFVYSLDYKK